MAAVGIYVYILRCTDGSYYVEAQQGTMFQRVSINTMSGRIRAIPFRDARSFWSGRNILIGSPTESPRNVKSKVGAEPRKRRWYALIGPAWANWLADALARRG